MSARRWLAAFLAFAVTDAAAVHVNPDGHGEILIYPYFTAQESEGNAFNTYVSIANDAVGAKALRVRVREGRNGRELASFNLLLAASDMWTGAIVPTASGARVITADASCTAPAFPQEGAVQALDFGTADYSTDGFGTDAERAREGYLEVFEMAAFDTAPGCDAFRNAAFGNPLTPRGKLAGTLTLINVESGLDFTVNPTALDNVATAPYARAASDPYPGYTAAEIGRSSGFLIGDRFYRTTWAAPLDAVNAALLAETLENEFVLDGVTRSGTDFIVTFPTLGAGNRSFYLSYWSREGEAWGLGSCDSLCPITAIADMRLPWASTVLSFRLAALPSGAAGISDVLGSRNGWRVALPTPFESGHMQVALDGVMEAEFPLLHSRINLRTGVATDVRPRYHGLPSLGFMVRAFRNGNLACTGGVCQGNYGGAFEHRRSRSANQ